MTLSFEDAVADLKALAEAKPDYVYSLPGHMQSVNQPSCAYVHTTEKQGELIPGCIVGHVVLNRGLVTAYDLREWEMSTPDDSTAEALFCAFPIDVESKARWLLQETQAAQDAGRTWADAVAVALATVIEG